MGKSAHKYFQRSFFKELNMSRSYNVTLLMVLVALSLSGALLDAQYRDDSGIEPPPYERIGQSGFRFLHLPSVARNAALAEVKGLVNNDVTAIFSNPANLVDIHRLDAAFSRLNYVAGITYITAAVGVNLNNWGAFGLHLANLDAGDMFRTENIYSESIGTTQRSGEIGADLGTFTAGDLLVGLSYARRVTDKLSIGANVGQIRETLDSTKVENWNIDFGIFFRTGFKSLTLSMVARNFGPDAEFTGFSELYGLPQSVRMPLDFRLGVSYDILEGGNGSPHQLTYYLEGVHPNDGPEKIHTSFEYTFLTAFSVRGGYKFNYDEQGLTLGSGINFSTRGMNGRIDYAFLDYGRLSVVHLFTVGFGFGG
jgi:hypothetical protein